MELGKNIQSVKKYEKSNIKQSARLVSDDLNEAKSILLDNNYNEGKSDISLSELSFKIDLSDEKNFFDYKNCKWFKSNLDYKLNNFIANELIKRYDKKKPRKSKTACGCKCVKTKNKKKNIIKFTCTHGIEHNIGDICDCWRNN